MISKNRDEVITLNYSKNSESLAEKQITSNDLISDLNELKNLNHIKNNGIYNSLLIKANFFN